MSYLYLPFLIQSILMGYDEVLHHKRGLGIWERLGHPLDSLTVFVPLSMIAMNDYNESRLTMYSILAVFSCLFITKDEFVHHRECSSVETWIHSVLFVLHPMIFLSSGILWKNDPNNFFLTLQPALVGIFMIYQILRWSFLWKEPLR